MKYIIMILLVYVLTFYASISFTHTPGDGTWSNGTGGHGQSHLNDEEVYHKHYKPAPDSGQIWDDAESEGAKPIISASVSVLTGYGIVYSSNNPGEHDADGSKDGEPPSPIQMIPIPHGEVVSNHEISLNDSNRINPATGGRITVTCFLNEPQIQIISVVEFKKPRRLIVKLRNLSGRFLALSDCYSIRLLNSENEVKVQSIFYDVGENATLTYQKSRHEEYADTYIYLLPKTNIKKLDWEKDANKLGERAKFAVSFQYYFGKQNGFQEDDVVALFYGNNTDAGKEKIEISRFPEEVAMSPMLNRNIATSWAHIKLIKGEK